MPKDSAPASTGVDAVIFPPGAPKRHQARKWGREIDQLLTDLELTSVARNKLPPGMFRKPWSDDALQPPPPLPAKPSFKDKMAHRSMTDEIEKRISANEQLQEQKEQWWIVNNNRYFVVIT